MSKVILSQQKKNRLNEFFVLKKGYESHMNDRKMFYFKICVKSGDTSIEISFDSDSSGEAKKKKQKLYDVFDEIFGNGNGVIVLEYLLPLLGESYTKIEAIYPKEAQVSKDVIIYPIEANIKLLNGDSSFWENRVMVEKVESGLLAKIKKDISIVFRITPREFEKVVAEIYYNLGFDVELTPIAKDGGKDVIVVGNDENGQQFMHFVECKRHNKRNPVGVSIVREFESIVRRDRAKMGIIVTTAHFTKDAKVEKEKYYNEVIEFSEFDKLINLIQ